MAEDTGEEKRQFEQVLNRLDALMKRSHAPMPVDEPPVSSAGEEGAADIPVLTEIYHGAELLPVDVAAENVPPLLTEFIVAPQFDVNVPVVEAVAPEPELSGQLQPLSEQQVESVVAELMPKLREMIARVVQEELFLAQQAVLERLAIEAEHLLRQRLLQETIPK